MRDYLLASLLTCSTRGWRDQIARRIPQPRGLKTHLSLFDLLPIVRANVPYRWQSSRRATLAFPSRVRLGDSTSTWSDSPCYLPSFFNNVTICLRRRSQVFVSAENTSQSSLFAELSKVGQRSYIFGLKGNGRSSQPISRCDHYYRTCLPAGSQDDKRTSVEESECVT